MVRVALLDVRWVITTVCRRSEMQLFKTEINRATYEVYVLLYNSRCSLALASSAASAVTVAVLLRKLTTAGIEVAPHYHQLLR